MADALPGVGVSHGVAAGPAVRMGRPVRLPAPRPVTDARAETARAHQALAATARDLAARAARAERATHAADRTASAIVHAQSLMAGDPELRDTVAAHVTAGADAAHAIDAAFADYRRQLVELGGYLADRAGDLDDVRNRAVAAALDVPMPGVPTPGHPFVLIADDLSPADTAGLDTSTVLALVTEQGGPTSHTAILARALGLPAVVACSGCMSLADGTLVSVDGRTGTVRLGITADEAEQARRQAAATAARGHVDGVGRTADGHRVPLLANVGSASDMAVADAAGAEGVGLFRTEFLFLDRRDPPTREEQVRAYAEVFRAAPTGRLTVRTLDAGADKPLPFLGLPDEPNPALGIRGIRVGRLHPDLLDTQLAAVAEAAAVTGADVQVMAPMVTTATEARDFADRARRHGLDRAGVMVEVPAAALTAARLLTAVDFLSIGTNDLGQYTMAADRQAGRLADLLDPWQPALLDLIAGCAAAAAQAGKPAGVCGEAAADPLLAAVLVGLGVTSLSMSARSLAAVRDELARHTLEDCRAFAAQARAADSAAEARAAALQAAEAPDMPTVRITGGRATPVRPAGRPAR
ncbi:phosphoenolpyruvate--protein phosphotransferase [Streptomycetaceae bacterium NBC_01309]